MVSRVRYSHVFNQWFRGRRSYHHILQLVLGLAVAVMVKELAVPVIFCWFSFESPLRAGWRAMTRRQASSGEPPNSTESPAPEPPQLPGAPLAS
jgi:CDP-diacylglycerol--serine O-phosphatidyltransferase